MIDLREDIVEKISGLPPSLHEGSIGVGTNPSIAFASTLICKELVVLPDDPSELTAMPEVFYFEGRERLSGSPSTKESPYIIVRREGEEDEIVEVPTEPKSIDDLREVVETLWMSHAERLRAMELALGRRVDAREIEDPLMAGIFSTNNPKDAFGLIASYKMLLEP